MWQRAPIESLVLCKVAERVLQLGEAPFWNSVTALNLQGNNLQPWALSAIFKAEGIHRLRELNLSGTLLGPQGAVELAKAKNLAGLTHLSLNCNRIGFSGVSNLVKA